MNISETSMKVAETKTRTYAGPKTPAVSTSTSSESATEDHVTFSGEEAGEADIPLNLGQLFAPSAQPVGPIKAVSSPLPNGGTLTSETFTSPDGDYSASYRSLTDERGEVVERAYRSHQTKVTPVGNYSEGGQDQLDFMTETASQDLLQKRDKDGQFGPTTGEVTYTDQTSNSGQGFLNVTRYGTEPNPFFNYDSKNLATGWTERQEFQDEMVLPEVPEQSPFESGQSQNNQPDGGSSQTTWARDNSNGYNYSSTLESDASGQPRSRTVSTTMPQDPEDPAGLSWLANFGHDSAQRLVDEHISGGEFNFQAGQGRVERFDDSGQVDSVEHFRTGSWRKADGSAALDMTELEGMAPQYTLTKVEGDNLAVQNFVQGSEDTRVSREFTDQQGFRTVETLTETPDAAAAALEDGAKSTVAGFESVARAKENADLEDLKTLLGEDFDQLVATNPEFQSITDGMSDQQTFPLVETRSNVTTMSPGRYGRGGSGGPATESESSARSIGLDLNGQRYTLSMGDEDTWSLGQPQAAASSTGPEFSALGLVANGDIPVELAQGALRATTRSADDAASLSRKLDSTGKAFGVVGLVDDTLSAMQSAREGNWSDAFRSAASVGEGLGGFAPTLGRVSRAESLAAGRLGRVAQGAAQGAALVGSSALVIQGGTDLLVGGDPRGAFTMLEGGGTLSTLLGITSSTVGGAITSVGVAGGMAYDYVESTDMADSKI